MKKETNAIITIACKESFTYIKRELRSYSEHAEGVYLWIESSPVTKEWLSSFGEYGSMHLFGFEFDFQGEWENMHFTGYILGAYESLDGSTLELKLKFNKKSDIN